MKENIYTIPVLDALKEDCECTFCFMKEKLEQDAINFVLGPSYMEVDVRGKTNELGFCQKHMKQLYERPNSLGLALMLHSHMISTREQLEKLLKSTSKKKTGLKKLLKSNNNNEDNDKLSLFINNLNQSCYICDTVSSTFERYVETFFFLWKKDTQVKDMVKNSKGFCIDHFYILFNYAQNKLSAKEFEEFVEIVVPLQLENLKRVEDDLEWFTMKFDHRFRHESWKNSKDAIPRSIIKTSSLYVQNSEEQ